MPCCFPTAGFCSLCYLAWLQRLWSVALYTPCSLQCHHGNVYINVNFNSHYTSSSSNLCSVPQSLLICSSHKATYLLLFSNTSAVDTKGKWHEQFSSGVWKGVCFFSFLFFFSLRSTVATLPNVTFKTDGKVWREIRDDNLLSFCSCKTPGLREQLAAGWGRKGPVLSYLLAN